MSHPLTGVNTIDENHLYIAPDRIEANHVIPGHLRLWSDPLRSGTLHFRRLQDLVSLGESKIVEVPSGR